MRWKRGDVCKGKDGKKDRTSTGRGRQRYKAKTGRVEGNKAEAKRTSLDEVFHLASVCHVDCHFSSRKQVERLHLQYRIFKNAWSHCGPLSQKQSI